MVGKRIKSKKCPFLLAFISFCCIFVPYLKRTAMAKKEKINKTDIVNVLEQLSEQELRCLSMNSVSSSRNSWRRMVT